jgi:hypothetical protein
MSARRALIDGSETIEWQRRRNPQPQLLPGAISLIIAGIQEIRRELDPDQSAPGSTRRLCRQDLLQLV